MTLSHLSRVLEELYGKPLPVVEIDELRGDASTRSYFRVHVDNPPRGKPSQLIAMQLPEDAFQSDEGGKQPTAERLPFLEVAELLDSKGIPVPAIYVEDLARGLILLEDLGDVTLEDRLARAPETEWRRLYGEAVDLLAELHERCADLPPGSIVGRRSFDRDLLQWELEHFRQWGLEALFGALGQAQSDTLNEVFSAIVREIETMPYGFAHRDYQSRNLLFRPSGDLAIIDFQDALLGPRVYDLVALLCDSYVPLGADLQEEMIERYAAARRIDPEAIRDEFWVVTLHRKLKDAGRFVYIDRIRNNADFLQWYPRSLMYVGRALSRVNRFARLESVLENEISGFPDAIEQPRSVME